MNFGILMKNYARITAKCVEVSKCFLNKRVGLHSYELYNTRSIGNIARLAVNLSQAEILEENQLAAIGAAVKIDFPVIKSEIIPILEELNWIEIEKDRNRINKIYESIPPVEDILPRLGKLWEEREPNDIDITTIKSLSLLKNRPIKKDALMSQVDVLENSFETALDYGLQTNYFGAFKSSESNESIIWTPYYWARNSEKALKFLKRQTYDEFTEIEKITAKILKSQGRPFELVKGDSNTLKYGIQSGFFPAVGIEDRNGFKHYYIFTATPQFGLEPKKDIFEKARLIVACVRHGEHHAEISRIKRPLSLLKALRESRMKPHSYAKIQYALLILNRICTYKEVLTTYGKSYKIIFIDTPENQRAMDLAEEMLKSEEPVTGIFNEPEVNNLFAKGLFNYSAELRQIISEDNIRAPNEYNILMENIQGSRL